MAKTVGDVVELALHSLNDQLGHGLNPDDQIALYNRALRTFRRTRPDAFVGALTAAPTEATQLEDAVPYDDELIELHAHLMVVEQRLTQDEEANLAKAEVFSKRASGP